MADDLRCELSRAQKLSGAGPRYAKTGKSTLTTEILISAPTRRDCIHRSADDKCHSACQPTSRVGESTVAAEAGKTRQDKTRQERLATSSLKNPRPSKRLQEIQLTCTVRTLGK